MFEKLSEVVEEFTPKKLDSRALMVLCYGNLTALKDVKVPGSNADNRRMNDWGVRRFLMLVPGS
jgi:hypothetical protein